jgi:phenylacetate-CoA ligase
MYSNIYSLVRYYLSPGGNVIRQQTNNLERTQWLSTSELKNLQLKEIQKLIRYAYEHVPFYRKRFISADIYPEDIKSWQDFQAIPFLTRDDVQNHLDELLSKEYQGKTFEYSTGGSTGQPLQCYKNTATRLWDSAIEKRSRGWYGFMPGHKQAWIWGFPKDYPEWHWKSRLMAHMHRCRYLNVRLMNKEKMRVFAEMLLRWEPDMFRCYPSAIYLFARFIIEEGITGIRPKFIETTSEKLLPHQRTILRDVFEAPIAENYSSWEIVNIAYQCPNGGLHVNEDRYLELIANGKAVQPGELGEIVITSLNQYAMPYIRYKIGDIGIYEPNNCSCGRSMPVLREVTGRTNDCLLDTDGSVVHWTISPGSMLAKNKTEVSQYQLYQPDREHIEVRLVCDKVVKPILLEDIRNELKSCFREDMQISVKVVDKIDLTPAGKRRYIISDVRPSFLYSEQNNYH